MFVPRPLNLGCVRFEVILAQSVKARGPAPEPGLCYPLIR